MTSKRVILTLEDKIKVLNVHNQGTSARKLAVQFNCSKNQINNIVKNKNSLLKEYEDFKSCGIKRKRREKFGDINEAVLQWFKSARLKNVPLNGTLLKEKAIEIAEAVGVEDFCASNGWLEKFCHRNNIIFNVDEEKVLEDYNSRLSLILAGYENRNIYNLGETGLFFRALPTKTLMERTEEAKGGKHAKERFTVFFCVNAAGEKETPIIIAKYQRPNCLKNVDVSKMEAIWKSNKKAWMTKAIFEQWLSDFDNKMADQGRNVILLLDSVPCHVDNAQLKNVKLHFLPPNATSKIQPIIYCFKLEYRRFVLKRLISLDSSKIAADIVISINVFDAIQWITCAWNNVETQTIMNCFKASGLDDVSVEDSLNYISNLEDEVILLTRAAGVNYDSKSHEYEEALECYDDLSEDWDKPIEENIDLEIQSDSDDEGLPVKLISCQETLEEINKLIKTSIPVKEDARLNYLLTEVRECLEKKVVDEKLLKFKQTSFDYFF